MTQPVVTPPSSALPSVRRIREHSIDVLATLVEYLRAIYNPPVRGARRVDHTAPKNTSRAKANPDADRDALESLRADAFERAYAVRWLTGLVSQATLLGDTFADADEGGSTSPSIGSRSLPAEYKVDALIRSATALIAVCAGTAAARTLTRRFSFPSPALGTDVEVQLTDVPIAVEGGTPTVGTQTWGSACLLAEMLMEDPGRFGLSEGVLGGVRDVRVLELGAGTGLVSLALAKLIADSTAKPAGVQASAKVTIVASDYEPTVLENLRCNIRANFPAGAPSHVSLSARSLDWSRFSLSADTASHTPESACDEPFDVILGADVVYEPTHTLWIRDCVSALLRRPLESGHFGESRFHLVMPLRPTHSLESRAVEEAFPPAPHKDAPLGSTLCVLGKEAVTCEVEGVCNGRAAARSRYRSPTFRLPLLIRSTNLFLAKSSLFLSLPVPYRTNFRSHCPYPLPSLSLSYENHGPYCSL